MAVADENSKEKEKRRPRGLGGLFKRSNGLWTGSVEIPTVDGKRRRSEVSSKDYKTAVEKLRKLQDDVANGILPVTGKTTVDQWMTRWLESVHGPSLRPKALKSYSDTYRLHISPYIGSKRLDKLTSEEIRGMHRIIQKGLGAQKASTRNAQLAHIVLSRALKDALREGLIRRNPADAVATPKHTTKEREPLDIPSAKQFLRWQIDNNDPLATRRAAAFLTGCRPGEMIGLTWDRCDLENELMDISWQLQQLSQVHGCGEKTDAWPCGRIKAGYCPQRKWDLPPGFEHEVLHRSLVLTRPKTNKGTRVIPIAPPLLALLTEYAKSQTGPNPHGLVWHHPDGRPISPREDHALWKEALEGAGLPDSPPYASRHTVATLLMEAGVEEMVRMQILGQSSVQAHRGYTHVNQAHTRAALSNLNELLS
ncbi:site-specific integrase [Mycobacteroides abscessus]|nr:site-specific integrase [Mycobacteroides abscessus]MDM2540843.1 site-specific integrase [Mycobacteroides abscessus]